MSTILVVDGRRSVASLLAKTLETEGFSVRLRPTCADALRHSSGRAAWGDRTRPRHAR